MLKVSIFEKNGTTITVTLQEFETRNKFDAKYYRLHGTRGPGIEGEPIHREFDSKFDLFRYTRELLYVPPTPLCAWYLNEIAKG